MAIRVQTQGRSQLELRSGGLATAIAKPNFTAGRTIDGVANLKAGYWMAFMLRLPTTGGTGSWSTENTRRFLLGGGSTNTGQITENTAGTSADLGAVWMGQDNNNTANFSGALRLRPRVLWRHSTLTANGFPTSNYSTNQFDNDFTGIQIITRGDAWLFVIGVVNVAADPVNDTPNWRGFVANCKVGANGTTEVVTSQLTSTAVSNSHPWLTGTSAQLMRQVFEAAPAATGNRTPVDTTIEHIGLVQGNFPWDTVNNPTAGPTGLGRPHHSAVAALAGMAGITPHTYASLVTAQNAGTLGYANLRSGKGDLTHWWTLADLTTAGLTSTGSGTPVAFEERYYNGFTSGGLANTAPISPAHWQGGAPSIAEPPVKFHGGRGTAPFTIGGTYQTRTTALQRRWETAAGAALPGFDWEAVDVFGGGTWQTTDTLPVGGPYTLRVRDTNDVARAAAMTDMLVGTVMLTHGQSGMAQSLSGAVSEANNNLHGITLSANAIGLFVAGSNNDAGGASYVKPVPNVRAMNPGATPANVGSSACLLLNEWAVHNPGHPLCIANMAISDTGMNEWSENGVRGQWTFLGTVGEPGASNAGGVGRVGHYAWMLGQRVDCHVLMWMPNMGSTSTIRGNYITAIRNRFANSPNAPWLLLPPWRGFRSPPDDGVTQRQNHVLMVGELNALVPGMGVLGPYWPDSVMDRSLLDGTTETTPWLGSGHGAYQIDATVTGTEVSDQNQVGNTRLGRGMGRALAWVYDRTIKAFGPRVLAAWSDNGRATVNVELGRVVRTLNGVAISNANVARQFWISLNNGSSWTRGDGRNGQNDTVSGVTFTVSLDATGTRAILTPADGGTAWAAAGANLRVDYARNWPFGPEGGTRPGDVPGTADERLSERMLDALLYDDQTYRGGTNLATPAGNPVASAIGSPSGVAVQTRGAAKLVATERWTGSRNVTVRMMAADGVTVLRERALAINGS